MIDHGNIMFAATSVMTYLQLSENDIILNVLPLSFSYGLYQVLMTFKAGGRLVDDIIKSRGGKVAPNEVEKVLYGLPGVVEAAVVGVPDPILGQIVKAFIVLNGIPLTRHAVLAYCKAHLEDHMIPRLVEFRTALPHTASGKIMKRELTQGLSRQLAEFQSWPHVLFVYMTAPPLAPRIFEERLWKLAVKKVIGRPTWTEEFADRAALARDLNNWIAAADGWLETYPLKNVAVFDYYDVLTGHGASDLLRFPTEVDGVQDSHPSREGNSKAASEFVPFLNRAIRRAGLSG